MRAELAEAIGTFALVFAGCGAIMADAAGAGLGPVGIALTFTFVVAAMVYAIGHVSGAHINPAVTLAFAAVGRFPWRRAPSYIAAQVVGGLAAAGLLRLLLGLDGGLGVTTLAAGLPVWKGVVFEIVATGFLCFTIASVATDARAQGAASGLAIGIAVGLGALFAGSLTGASMNPARSLGPALVAGSFTHLWLYLLAPVVGGILAMAAYEVVRAGSVPERQPVGELTTGEPSTAPNPATEGVQ